MSASAKSYIVRPSKATESVSISARLTGDYAKMWALLTHYADEDVAQSTLVREAIHLLAFVAHQNATGQNIWTNYFDEETGESIVIDDVVSFLDLSLACHSDTTEEMAASEPA